MQWYFRDATKIRWRSRRLRRRPGILIQWKVYPLRPSSGSGGTCAFRTTRRSRRAVARAGRSSPRGCTPRGRKGIPSRAPPRASSSTTPPLPRGIPGRRGGVSFCARPRHQGADRPGAGDGGRRRSTPTRRGIRRCSPGCEGGRGVACQRPGGPAVRRRRPLPPRRDEDDHGRSVPGLHAVLATMPVVARPGAPRPSPARIRSPGAASPSWPLPELRLLPSVPWDAGIRGAWSAARRRGGSPFRISGRRDGRLSRDRDRPDGTGRPGSPRTCTSAASAPARRGTRSSRARGWTAGRVPRAAPRRSFASWCGGNSPITSCSTFRDRPRTAAGGVRLLSWRDDPAALVAWQEGRTGYPLVDAGMRQLWKTGWVHNRVRMVVASFLVKDLLLPWRKGAAWFFDTLVDGDLANNTFGWQWVAGCGADAAPYFRSSTRRCRVGSSTPGRLRPDVGPRTRPAAGPVDPSALGGARRRAVRSGGDAREDVSPVRSSTMPPPGSAPSRPLAVRARSRGYRTDRMTRRNAGQPDVIEFSDRRRVAWRRGCRACGYSVRA